MQDPTTSPSGDLIPTIRGSGAHPGRGKTNLPLERFELFLFEKKKPTFGKKILFVANSSMFAKLYTAPAALGDFCDSSGCLPGQIPMPGQKPHSVLDKNAEGTVEQVSQTRPDPFFPCALAGVVAAAQRRPGWLRRGKRHPAVKVWQHGR